MNVFSIVWLIISVVIAVLVFFDARSLKHSQSMRVMSWVWTLTSLWGGLFIGFAYLRIGRNARSLDIKHNEKLMDTNMSMEDNPSAKTVTTMNAMNISRPYFQRVLLSTLHCGAGCTLADIIGESFTFFVPISIADSIILGSWVLDYLLALVIGVWFQYAAIRQMNNIGFKDAILRAVKADFWSLTAWQIGMYLFLSVIMFGMGIYLPKTSPEFWFVMQIAMAVGFVLAYPMNILLIKLGVK